MKSKFFCFLVFGIVFLSGCRGSGESVSYEDVHLGGSEGYYLQYLYPQHEKMPVTHPTTIYNPFVKPNYYSSVSNWSCAFACIHSWISYLNKVNPENISREEMWTWLRFNIDTIDRIWINTQLADPIDAADLSCFYAIETNNDIPGIFNALITHYSGDSTNYNLFQQYKTFRIKPIEYNQSGKSRFLAAVMKEIKYNKQPVMLFFEKYHEIMKIDSAHTVMLAGYKINKKYPNNAQEISEIHIINSAKRDNIPYKEWIKVNDSSATTSSTKDSSVQTSPLEAWKLGFYYTGN